MFNDLERKAWETRDGAAQHKPEMACKAALDQIERGVLTKPKHIIVVVVETGDNDSDIINIIQAGIFSEIAVEGALGRAIAMSREGIS